MTGGRIPLTKTEISVEAREAVMRVLTSGWVSTGPEVVEFEREVAAWLGASHAIAVSSCTAAIELALRAMHLRPGAKVLTSTMTFCGAIHAIAHAGLQPVLVDINPETLMPDASTTRDATQSVGGVDAIVVIHYAGYPAPIDQLAEAAGVGLDRVVEDAAHAMGTRDGERLVGSASTAACFSFYATKNLPIGEGGLITTEDPEIAELACRARLNGMSKDAWARYMPGSKWRYSVEVAGLKANMTDVQAAIGRAQLRHLSRWQDDRTRIARQYEERLTSLKGIATPPRPRDGRHSWHLYVIRVDASFGLRRDDFIAGLSERGIDCSVHFIPAHHMPYFRRFLNGDDDRAFPVADSVFPQIVSLPMYPSLGADEVERVCEAIFELARGSTGAPRVLDPYKTSGEDPGEDDSEQMPA